jgi:hypothetical protein
MPDDKATLATIPNAIRKASRFTVSSKSRLKPLPQKPLSQKTLPQKPRLKLVRLQEADPALERARDCELAVDDFER